MGAQVQEPSMAVASVPFGPRHLKAGHAEARKEPRGAAVEEHLGMPAAGIGDNAEGKRGAQPLHVRGARSENARLAPLHPEALPSRRKIDVAEIDLGCLDL